jgi:hypothetical protein
MNTLERIQAFEDLIKLSEEQHQLIGTGNPLAPILIIGRESAHNAKDRNEIDEHITINIKAVKDCFYNCDITNLYLQVHPKEIGRTWNVYQKLVDFILYDSQQIRGPLTPLPFGAWTFVSEMNNTACPKTVGAEDRRRPDYFRHRFFQDFPVTILACSNYIENKEGNWQINNIFGVTFDETNGERKYGKGNWYFIHKSADKKRLVIHTRQLSQNVSGEMLRDMAKTIRDHLITNEKFPNHYLFQSCHGTVP